MKAKLQTPAVFAGVAALAAALSWTVGCPIRRLLGIGCPLCGISRALRAVLHLDLPEAFALHPLWPVIFPGLFLCIVLERRRAGGSKGLALGLLILFLAVYALRLWRQDPVVWPGFSAGLLSGLFQ